MTGKDVSGMKCSFELVHIGINHENETEAAASAGVLAKLFGLTVRMGEKSVFAGSFFECVKMQFLGKNGHIAMCTENLSAAVEEWKEEGVAFRMDTATYDENGRLKNIYLDEEIAGFAIHVLQK